MKQLKKIHEETRVKASPEKMWEILAQFGNVCDFHAGVVSSAKEVGSDNAASMGCQRVCNIVDMGLHITLKERVIDYVEGKTYQFEVYECKNFPIKEMYFRFTLKDETPTHATVAIDISYQAKPAFLTPLLAWKMHSLARDVLLGYKHYAETGEKRAPIKKLKQRYKTSDLFGPQVDHYPVG